MDISVSSFPPSQTIVHTLLHVCASSFSTEIIKEKIDTFKMLISIINILSYKVLHCKLISMFKSI